MKAVVLFFPAVILLWVFSTANAKPAIATKSNQHNLQYTNIGDITAKDLMRIADESTPADKRLSVTPEQMDNEIEAQTNQYYETLNNNIELASPKDQETHFVHLLKKQYRGTFPEYGKETKSNYAKNKELEDNLDVQPETALFGHSDEYHGKSGNNEDNNDYLIPDDVPSVDNLDTFDSDSNVLNHERQDALEGDSFHGKVASVTKSPSHTTTRHYLNQETDENEEIQNSDSTQSNAVDIKDISEEYDKAKEATGIEDSLSGSGEEQDEALETSDDTQQELDRMKEKLEEEQLWDLQEKLRQNVSLNKTENEKEKPTKKQKPKKKDKSRGILKEFEELQGHNKNPADRQNGTIGDNKTSAETIKVKASPEPQKESGKKIKYIHTEDSQVTGDAILDFLDKLLENDPKRLRHDVLSMAKELQNEGDSKSNNGKAILADEKQKSEQSHFSSTENKQQEKSGSFKNIHEEKEKMGEKEIDEDKETDEVKDKEKENDTDREKEANKYIPNMEDKIHEEKEKEEEKEKDEEKQADEVKDLEKENDTGKEKKADKYVSNMEDKIDELKEKEDDDQAGNDDYEDKEYNEFHDPLQEIYPDHDNGEATRNEPENDSSDTGRGSKAEDDKVKKVQQKDEDKFDYEEFKEEALKMHNEFRKRHNAVALEWSDKLAKEATDGAAQLVHATRNFFKRELEKHGHSVAILPYLTKDIAKSAVEKWYSEITKFSFAKPEIKRETRDFTQIIWKGSKEVGMGFAYSADKKKTLVVALYSPSGNNEQEIKNNLGNVNNDPYADIRKAAIGKHS